jgi:hypothetical protein
LASTWIRLIAREAALPLQPDRKQLDVRGAGHLPHANQTDSHTPDNDGIICD